MGYVGQCALGIVSAKAAGGREEGEERRRPSCAPAMHPRIRRLSCTLPHAQGKGACRRAAQGLTRPAGALAGAQGSGGREEIDRNRDWRAHEQTAMTAWASAV